MQSCPTKRPGNGALSQKHSGNCEKGSSENVTAGLRDPALQVHATSEENSCRSTSQGGRVGQRALKVVCLFDVTSSRTTLRCCAEGGETISKKKQHMRRRRGAPASFLHKEKRASKGMAGKARQGRFVVGWVSCAGAGARGRAAARQAGIGNGECGRGAGTERERERAQC